MDHQHFFFKSNSLVCAFGGPLYKIFTKKLTAKLSNADFKG